MVNNKQVFWQALVITLVVFALGLFLGILFEKSRNDNLQKIYSDSETNIFDVMLQQQLLTNKDISCEFALNESILFADSIYWEARTLEKYDSSNQLTSDLINLHKRYDMLRTILWSQLIELQDNCNMSANLIVYIYEYNNPSIKIRARQSTFSNVLLGLKENYKDKVILIPIAHDTGINSFRILEKKYGINEYPVILINGKHKITQLVSESDVIKYLNP